MADIARAPTVSTDQDALKSGETGVGLWLRKIALAQDVEKDWRKDASKAIQHYEADNEAKGVYNIHHSNIETMVPALYNTTPIPDVRRRYYDTDPVSRLGAEFIERIISCSLDKLDFDDVMLAAVQDAVNPGRGVARIRYEGDHEPIIGMDGKQVVGLDGEPAERIVRQRAWFEIVQWDKWVHGPGHTWDTVPWVAFEHDMTEDDLADLGVDQKTIASLGYGDGEAKKGDDNKDKDPPAGVYKTVNVFEVWDKRTKKVIWLTDRDKTKPLKTFDDPLGLTGFFPIPKPLRQVQVAGKLKPICPSKVHWPLIDELDEVSRRIKRLVKMLKVKAAADPALRDILDKLQMADDGDVVTNDQSSLSFQGGTKVADMISFWPLEPIVTALNQLYQQREQIKQSIYEISGISDILRGATNPNETLGAQQIKAQWGNQRVQKLQKEVQRFVRDAFRLLAEVHINLFEWDRLKAMTRMDFVPQADQQPQPQTVMGHNGGPPMDEDQQEATAAPEDYEQAVHELLTSEDLPYAIDIETDSTIRADLSRSQEQMNMFLQGTAQFVQAIATLPQAGLQGYVQPMTKVWATTFARQFQFGKEAEDALEKVAESEMQQPGPDPRIAEAEAKIQQMQQVIQQLEQQLSDKAADREAKAHETEAKLRHEATENDKQRAFDGQFRDRELALKEHSAHVAASTADLNAALKIHGAERAAVDREIDLADRDEDRQLARDAQMMKITNPSNGADANV